MVINTETLSARYREASVDLYNKQLLITNFYNTQQENDLTEPPNCKGFGRIRHFRRSSNNVAIGDVGTASFHLNCCLQIVNILSG